MPLETKQPESTDTEVSSIDTSMSKSYAITSWLANAVRSCFSYISNSNEPIDEVESLHRFMMWSNKASLEDTFKFNALRGHQKDAADGYYGDVGSERAQMHVRRFEDCCAEMKKKYEPELQDWPAQLREILSDMSQVGGLL
ncbi:hypothetical protein I302_107726 [Kwoniella bestiolae CBS 10118]|uniref:Uncharacterized protein n=1 Tax=Kwoniella bestiolae CBS 10118 TaxID=1296100 RepID=A0A1B9FXQ0_9TREE|nr:hypothetical protein I302_06535 [Kwoniella bestiolae CBS 10118]OCF23552.1 hypothetical protein I302_06535 [Kwoniella bestiolae CBS 10118]